MRLVVTVMAMATVLLGCAGSGVQAADEPLVEAYRLQAGDEVRVTVFGHEDLSGEFEIDASGNITLPLVQDIPAGGLGLKALERAIINALQPDYLKNPRVTVEMLTFRPFYIIGEVRQPGSYPYVNGMTVINAVAVAGGYTYRARKNRIQILRGAEPDQQKISAGSDTPILPGDVIEVPERFF